MVDKTCATAHELSHVGKLKRGLRYDRGVDEISVCCAGMLIIDVAQQHLRRPVESRPSLDCGGAADERSHLNVGQQGLGSAFRQYPGRPADTGLITRLVWPVVMVQERLILRCLCPQGQSVVTEMIVQIDQSGNYKSIPCFNDRGVSESGGRTRSSGGYSFNKTVISEVYPTGEHCRRITAAHRNNAACDDKRHRCLPVRSQS